MSDFILSQGHPSKLACILYREEEKENVESNSFVFILDHMEVEKQESLD